MSQLHVAVLDEELPFPLTSGKRIRTYHLLSRLSARHRITYLCHQNPDDAESLQADRAMSDLGIRTMVVPRLVPAKSGLGFYARLAGNLLSSLPYSVATHCSHELRQAALDLNKEDPPDLWHCEWTPYAQTWREPIGQAPRLIMAHNVESLIWERLTAAEPHPLKRWYIRHQFRKYERFERWAFSANECIVAVSDEDARLIRERFGGKRVEVVDNGVDTSFFVPANHDLRDPKRILFLGSLDWRPNLDAVKLMLDEIFPQVRSREPSATLAIVGRKPVEWLRQRCSREPGVELHADVSDVRPHLERTGVLAVPLRIGGGSRLKILEALSSGLPVVTTAIGVEGLHLEPNRHVTVADAVDAFAQALLDVLANSDLAGQQAMRGRQWILERYDWSGLADRLEHIWQQCPNVSKPSAQTANSVVA